MELITVQPLLERPRLVYTKTELAWLAHNGKYNISFSDSYNCFQSTLGIDCLADYSFHGVWGANLRHEAHLHLNL